MKSCTVYLPTDPPKYGISTAAARAAAEKAVAGEDRLQAEAEAVRAEPSELRCGAVTGSLTRRVRTALEQSLAVTTLLRARCCNNHYYYYFPGPFFRPAFFFRGPAAFSIFFST